MSSMLSTLPVISFRENQRGRLTNLVKLGGKAKRAGSTTSSAGKPLTSSPKESETTLLDLFLTTESRKNCESYEYCSKTFHLPKRLAESVAEMRDSVDDKMRIEHLMHFADNYGIDFTCHICRHNFVMTWLHVDKKMKTTLKSETNKVIGCLSTVHIHGSKELVKTVDDAGNIIEAVHMFYVGDSNSQLTKGI
jgi:hypothetical protein